MTETFNSGDWTVKVWWMKGKQGNCTSIYQLGLDGIYVEIVSGLRSI
jgi:hypothetical protein